MHVVKKAISIAALVAAAFVSQSAYAEAVGTIKKAGPLVSIRHPDQHVSLASEGSAFEQGDVVLTGKTTDATLVMADGQVVYLKPNSAFRIDNYKFAAVAPEEGVSFTSILKGGLRTVSGLIGKKNHDNYALKTPTATIGIRGTDYSAMLCGNGSCDGLEDGVHVFVYDGHIVVSDDTVSQDINTNEGAIIKKATDAITPMDSGVMHFTPPVEFFTPKHPGC
ncbi:acyl-CoA dehydrogenase [Novimethylophilus kurashikiensis]|uniref:Acyl-CoA dehydrogenase n=1 Tax=Novimethylophilus kurashikiensis TaxID=1825523 RepID=A0A2R5F8I9_9PROT|nr:FecR family protein [Novimethylophilus kurashikiensis]GBG14345.1 acyl-CoA dehydrogenase [Novimethylophilus kurashikiensis]